MNVSTCPLCRKTDTLICANCVKCGNFSRQDSPLQLFFEAKETVFGRKVYLSNLKDNLKAYFDAISGKNQVEFFFRNNDSLKGTINMYKKYLIELQDRISTINKTIQTQKQNILNLNLLFASLPKDEPTFKKLDEVRDIYKYKQEKMEKISQSLLHNVFRNVFIIGKESYENKKFDLVANDTSQLATPLTYYQINGISYQLWPTENLTERYHFESKCFDKITFNSTRRPRRYTTSDERFGGQGVAQLGLSPLRLEPARAPKLNPLRVEMACEALPSTMAYSNDARVAASHFFENEMCANSTKPYTDIIETIANPMATLNSYFSTQTLASLTHLIQLLRVVSEILDIPLPYTSVFSSINYFCVDKILDPIKGSHLVEELFHDINYLCCLKMRFLPSLEPSIHIPTFSHKVHYAVHGNGDRCLVGKFQNYDPIRNLYILFKSFIEPDNKTR